MAPRCVVQYMRGTNVQNASNQHCEHPGFPGASSVCNGTPVSLRTRLKVKNTRGLEGIYRSSLDA
eukprot:1084960-Pyramimonas_sp.AAC.1